MTKHILNLCLYLIFHNLSWLNPNRSKCVNQAPTKSMLLCYMLDAGAIWDVKLSEINSWFSNLYGTFMSIRPKKKKPAGQMQPCVTGLGFGEQSSGWITAANHGLGWVLLRKGQHATSYMVGLQDLLLDLSIRI